MDKKKKIAQKMNGESLIGRLKRQVKESEEVRNSFAPGKVLKGGKCQNHFGWCAEHQTHHKP